MHDLALDVFADRWLNADIYRLRRAARDLYARAARGAFFYVAANIVFLLTLDKPSQMPWFAWLPTLLYVAVGILRLTHKVPDDASDAATFRRWRFRHWLIIDLGCLLWCGHLLRAGMLDQPFSLTMMVAL